MHIIQFLFRLSYDFLQYSTVTFSYFITPNTTIFSYNNKLDCNNLFIIVG